MKKIAVFASGSGSDFQSVIDLNEKENFCEIALLIASKPDIFAIERAKKHNIDFAVFEKKKFENTEIMFNSISILLKEKAIDFIVLAGYLTVIPQNFIGQYRNKIINIHPSLIPSFCGEGFYGLKVHKAAIDYGVKLSGCTVHFVDEQADTGAVIMQEAVEVTCDDTAESLQRKVLEKEHICLPKAVKLLTMGKIQIDGRKVIIKE